MTNKPMIRWGVLALVIAVVLFILVNNRKNIDVNATEMSYSALVAAAQEKKISEAKFDSAQRVLATLTPEGTQVYSIVPSYDKRLMDALVENGARIDVVEPSRPSQWTGLLIIMLPALLIVGFFYWLYRKSANGGAAGAAMGFGKHKGQMVAPGENTHRLADVAGCEEAKVEVAEIVEFLRNQEDFQRVSAKPPKGILMVGPPGTGKTLLAKAIAGEAGVPFFSTSGSEFVEMFVGVGAARVRSMFELVKQNAPAIIFIDEIDAVGRTRSTGGMGANDERDQTLNQLLVEMDGFQPNSGIVIIAATNRAEILDPALRRPGRFDREVHVSLPDRNGRSQILKLHASKVPMDVSINWDKVAAGTPGFSGADLANLINEAALLAARQKGTIVTMRHLEDARDKIIMGVERPKGMLNTKEREIVAYHEAGHALVARFSEGAEPVHKITIMPRGRALGVTMQLPREDSYNHDSVALRTNITVLMGGRAAEEVALDVKTVGASNDFHRATQLARRMIGVWGMGSLGTVSFHGEEGEDRWSPGGWSDHWKQELDNEATVMLHAEYERAVAIMREHRDLLEDVAQALLKEETVDADRFEELVQADLARKARESNQVEQAFEDAAGSESAPA